MPQTHDAPIQVTGFEWVPPFARGHVRDLRVRWALEEIGLDYRSRLISAVERPADYFLEQPFGQVPHYREGDVALFESGAIALYIAEKDERLLPRDSAKRARSISWLIAALNSVEPFIMQLQIIDLFSENQEWATLRRPEAVKHVETRLNRLSVALGEREWMESDCFTVADLIMIDVLRNLSPSQVSIPQNIAAYIARGTDRPAFKAAVAAQLADFLPSEEPQMEGEPA
jgi:glutathione S-transferase